MNAGSGAVRVVVGAAVPPAVEVEVVPLVALVGVEACVLVALALEAGAAGAGWTVTVFVEEPHAHSAAPAPVASESPIANRARAVIASIPRLIAPMLVTVRARSSQPS